MNQIVHKVAAYITFDNQFLVFIQPDFPDGVPELSGRLGDMLDKIIEVN